jgi:hypothetical protein
MERLRWFGHQRLGRHQRLRRLRHQWHRRMGRLRWFERIGR